VSRTRIAILAFFVLSAAVQLWIHRTGESSRPASELKRGATAPVFSLPQVDGTRVSLDDFRGKYVIIDFWASWCGPCMGEFSALSPWWKEQAETGLYDDVVFLAVNVRESRETVQSFLARSPLPFTVLLDGDASVARKYHVEGLPTLILIDRSGYVVDQTVGYDPTVAANMSAQLKKLMEEEKGAP